MNKSNTNIEQYKKHYRMGVGPFIIGTLVMVLSILWYLREIETPENMGALSILFITIIGFAFMLKGLIYILISTYFFVKSKI